MRSDLVATESNTYRQAAMADVVAGIDFIYDKHWSLDKVAWIVMGQFKKTGLWCAYEYADENYLSDPRLYQSIDKALLTRLFSLKRIERKLAGVI